jgi:hypothetical protein
VSSPLTFRAGSTFAARVVRPSGVRDIPVPHDLFSAQARAAAPSAGPPLTAGGEQGVSLTATAAA